MNGVRYKREGTRVCGGAFDSLHPERANNLLIFMMKNLRPREVIQLGWTGARIQTQVCPTAKPEFSDLVEMWSRMEVEENISRPLFPPLHTVTLPASHSPLASLIPTL